MNYDNRQVDDDITTGITQSTVVAKDEYDDDHHHFVTWDEHKNVDMMISQQSSYDIPINPDIPPRIHPNAIAEEEEEDVTTATYTTTVSTKTQDSLPYQTRRNSEHHYNTETMIDNHHHHHPVPYHNTLTWISTIVFGIGWPVWWWYMRRKQHQQQQLQQRNHHPPPKAVEKEYDAIQSPVPPPVLHDFGKDEQDYYYNPTKINDDHDQDGRSNNKSIFSKLRSFLPFSSSSSSSSSSLAYYNNTHWWERVYEEFIYFIHYLYMQYEIASEFIFHSSLRDWLWPLRYHNDNSNNNNRNRNIFIVDNDVTTQHSSLRQQRMEYYHPSHHDNDSTNNNNNNHRTASYLPDLVEGMDINDTNDRKTDHDVMTYIPHDTASSCGRTDDEMDGNVKPSTTTSGTIIIAPLSTMASSISRTTTAEHHLSHASSTLQQMAPVPSLSSSSIWRNDHPNDNHHHELEPAFVNDNDYPSNWMVYHPILQRVILKLHADAYNATMKSKDRPNQQQQQQQQLPFNNVDVDSCRHSNSLSSVSMNLGNGTDGSRPTNGTSTFETILPGSTTHTTSPTTTTLNEATASTHPTTTATTTATTTLNEPTASTHPTNHDTGTTNRAVGRQSVMAT